MANYQTELFGHVVYSPDLTYDELHSREEELKADLQTLLHDQEGDFIHFEPLGDTLRVQCVFSEGGDSFFHEVSQSVAPLMAHGISGRLLFVDKDLGPIFFYTMHQGRWQEAIIALPQAGALCPDAQPVTVPDLEGYPEE